MITAFLNRLVTLLFRLQKLLQRRLHLLRVGDRPHASTSTVDPPDFFAHQVPADFARSDAQPPLHALLVMQVFDAVPPSHRPYRLRG